MNIAAEHLPNKKPHEVSLAKLEGPELWKQQIRIDLAESRRCFRSAFVCLRLAILTLLVLLRTRTSEAIRDWVLRSRRHISLLVFRRKSAGVECSCHNKNRPVSKTP